MSSSATLIDVATRALTPNVEPVNEALRAISIPEFCERLGGLSHWSARKWIQEGRLKSVKIFGRRMIPISELQRALDGGLQ